MIALDLDGTILNYGDHTTQLRVNLAWRDVIEAGLAALEGGSES